MGATAGTISPCRLVSTVLRELVKQLRKRRKNEVRMTGIKMNEGCYISLITEKNVINPCSSLTVPVDVISQSHAKLRIYI